MTTLTMRHAATKAAVTALVAGCGGSTPPPPGDYTVTTLGIPTPGTPGTTEPAGGAPTVPVVVGKATLAGRFGDATALDTDTATASVDPSDPQSIRVEAWDPVRRWWVMTTFRVPDPWDAPGMAPGAAFSVPVTETAAATGGDPGVPLGYAGNTPGNASVDAPAQTLTLAVTQGANAQTRRIEFREEFSTGPSGWSLHGAFDYQL